MKRARRGKRTPVHKEERKAGMIKREREVETEQREGNVSCGKERCLNKSALLTS